ncbi:MAG: TolC family protein [Desulfuromonadales bacterium]
MKQSVIIVTTLQIACLLLPFPVLAVNSISVQNNAQPSIGLPPPAVLNGMKHTTDLGYTRLSLELDREVTWETHKLVKDSSGKPGRIYIDLNRTRLGTAVKGITIGDKLLKGVRVGQFKPEVVRVVLDSENLKDFKVFSLANPARLIIDVRGDSKPVNMALPKAKEPTVIIAKEVKPSNEPGVSKIVIPKLEKPAVTPPGESVVSAMEAPKQEELPAIVTQEIKPSTILDESKVISPVISNPDRGEQTPRSNGSNAGQDKPRVSPDNTHEYQLFQSANTLLKEKRYKEALDQFFQLITKYPQSELAPAAMNDFVLGRLEMSRQQSERTEPSKEAKDEKKNIKLILGSPEAAFSDRISETSKHGIRDSVNISATAEHVLDLKEYVAKSLETNVSHQINSADFKREYANTVAILQGYNFRISLDSDASSFYDNRFNYGADIALNVTKTLYDGGKKQILEKELEIVRLLSDARVIDSANNTILLAVNLYTTFYYLQEELSLLKFNFNEYQDLRRRIENTYQKGIRFSSFDYYSSKSLNLSLEQTLLRKKAELLKAETAFRQFANIHTDRHIRLKPLTITAPVNLVEIEKSAILDNSSIKVARLQKDLQLQKVDEKNADRGVTIKARSGLGAQFGSDGYIGTNSAFGSGTKPIAIVGINASLPIFDGGVRRSNILSEEIEALKQKLVLKKTTEDVIKSVNDIYADYRTLEKDLEITRELVDLNRKRTNVAVERFDKGLEEYRSVREAWSDSILAEIEAIRQNMILQKLLVDMTVLSGKKLFDL